MTVTRSQQSAWCLAIITVANYTLENIIRSVLSLELTLMEYFQFLLLYTFIPLHFVFTPLHLLLQVILQMSSYIRAKVVFF